MVFHQTQIRSCWSANIASCDMSRADAVSKHLVRQPDARPSIAGHAVQQNNTVRHIYNHQIDQSTSGASFCLKFFVFMVDVLCGVLLSLGDVCGEVLPLIQGCLNGNRGAHPHVSKIHAIFF